MTPRFCRGKSGFTLVELLVVIAIIGIVAGLLLPALTRAKGRAQRIQCVNNLKETGVAFHAFMHDHEGKFPMQVSVSEGGSMEFVQAGYHITGPFYFSFRHFQVLSNELVKPELLFCPSEPERQPAVKFSQLQNDNLSYFVGVAAEFGKPTSIIAGDRNITNDLISSITLVTPGFGNALHWTRELHRFKGNLLFADGHVEQGSTINLEIDKSAGVNPAFALPTVLPPGSKSPIANPPEVASPAKRSFANDHAPTPSGGSGGASRSGYASIASSGPSAAPMPAPTDLPSSGPTLSRNSGSASSTPQSSPVIPTLVEIARHTNEPDHASNSLADDPMPAIGDPAPAMPVGVIGKFVGAVSWWLLLLLLLIFLIGLTAYYLRRRAARQRREPID